MINTRLTPLLALHPCQRWSPLLWADIPSGLRDKLTSLSFGFNRHLFWSLLSVVLFRFELLSVRKTPKMAIIMTPIQKMPIIRIEANIRLMVSQTIWSIGRQKAPVFPEPVSAAIRTSPPPRINGIASDWISVGSLHWNQILINISFIKFESKLTSNPFLGRLLRFRALFPSLVTKDNNILKLFE